VLDNLRGGHQIKKVASTRAFPGKVNHPKKRAVRGKTVGPQKGFSSASRVVGVAEVRSRSSNLRASKYNCEEREKKTGTALEKNTLNTTGVRVRRKDFGEKQPFAL